MAIPPFEQEPKLESVYLSSQSASPLVIIFDVQTTSLSNEAEIIQLAATAGRNSTVPPFNQYVLPSGPISQGSSHITGLTVRGRGAHRQLCKNGKPMATVDQCTALEKFQN